LDRIRLPHNQALWPHPAYIARHRNIFVG
jgi:hypothetical protein